MALALPLLTTLAYSVAPLIVCAGATATTARDGCAKMMTKSEILKDMRDIEQCGAWDEQMADRYSNLKHRLQTGDYDGAIVR